MLSSMFNSQGGVKAPDIIIEYLSASIADGKKDEFLEAMENLLRQYAGDNWSYKFHVEG